MLLDTHTLLWFLTDDPQLPRSLKEQIGQQPLVYVSAAVIWEIAIKGSLGKLALGGKAIHSEEAVKEIIAACGVQEFEFLDVSPADAALAPFLKGAHRDPFDRLLAAQAVREGMFLVSCDPVFDEFIPTPGRLWTHGPTAAPPVKKRSQKAAKKTSGI
jgi:PIN domain nuclease of toxin-antitoxin system